MFETDTTMWLFSLLCGFFLSIFFVLLIGVFLPFFFSFFLSSLSSLSFSLSVLTFLFSHIKKYKTTNQLVLF